MLRDTDEINQTGLFPRDQGYVGEHERRFVSFLKQGSSEAKCRSKAQGTSEAEARTETHKNLAPWGIHQLSFAASYETKSKVT